MKSKSCIRTSLSFRVQSQNNLHFWKVSKLYLGESTCGFWKMRLSRACRGRGPLHSLFRCRAWENRIPGRGYLGNNLLKVSFLPYLESLAPSTMTLALIQAPIIAHLSYSLGLLHQLSPWMQVHCRSPGMGQESLAPRAAPSLLLLPHHLLPCPLHSPRYLHLPLL